MAPPASLPGPVHGRYTVQNPVLRWYLRLTDAVLARIVPRSATSRSATPHRVLLATGGHLGDAVVLTASIRRLREMFPEAEMGVVLPSWSKVVLASHPDVRWVHTVDHWKINRASTGLLAKWRQYRASRRLALEEIRTVGYDTAIDLYAYFPNMAALLWEARIPERAGFECGGMSALYTTVAGWGGNDRHMVHRQADVVDAAFAASPGDHKPRYVLPPADDPTQEEVRKLLHASGVAMNAYAVVHMGSGRQDRAGWGIVNWSAIVPALRARGSVVFTGQGAAECATVREVVGEEPGCVDLCGRLRWNAFVDVVRRARLLVTVDTAAAHVAAAVGTPSIVIWSGTTSDYSWRPLSENAHVVAQDVDVPHIVRLIGELIDSTQQSVSRGHCAEME